LFKTGILEVGKSNVVRDEFFLLGVHVEPHVLVLFGGLDNVLRQRFFGAVDDSPERVVIRLGLFLFEKLDFHVHEVDLFEHIFDILVFNVKVGIKAKALAFAQYVRCGILIFFGMVVDLIRIKRYACW
jgi:hypothetical protein